MAGEVTSLESADVFVFGATNSSGTTAGTNCPVPAPGVQCLPNARNSTSGETPAAGPHTAAREDQQQDKCQSATDNSSGDGLAVPPGPTVGKGAPAEGGQEGQGKLAEYFGVVFSPGSTSPARSPTGRVRRTVGHLNTMTPSPPGPLEASMNAGMAAISRTRRAKALNESPGPHVGESPTREELVSVQTRAMLELRVRTQAPVAFSSLNAAQMFV